MKKPITIFLVVALMLSLTACSTNSKDISIDTLKSEFEIDDLDVSELADGYSFEKELSSTTQDILITGTMDQNKNIMHVKFENEGVKYSTYFKTRDSAMELMTKFVEDVGSTTIADLKAAMCIQQLMNLYSLCISEDAGEALTASVDALLTKESVEKNNWRLDVSIDDSNEIVILEATYIK